MVPVIAQTSSYGSEVTAYNPNGGAITVNVSFYDAQNTATPGAQPCTPLSIGAGASVEFSLPGQCALPTGANFGLLVMAEATGTQRFYGYVRTQNPQGIGFSTEGFPIENFNDQLQHAVGLKRVAASGGLPAYQTNCFVATLGDAVNYELRLYDGATNTQLGSTLSGSLQPWQQYRYLDAFSAVGAPAGDLTNVRAQFTNLTGSNKKLIGFCTVQDNTSFSADFRIAKSYGGAPQNAFVQGGNAFGTTALLGTVDNQPLSVLVNNQPVMTYLPNATSPNIVGGHPSNSISTVNAGQTIAGGGQAGTNCYDPPTNTYTRSCGNQTASDLATIGGGYANLASFKTTVAGGTSNTASASFAAVAGGYGNTAGGQYSAVAGGDGNTASGIDSMVAGGYSNTASQSVSSVAGGARNTASGWASFAAGYEALADETSCAVFGLWGPSGAQMGCLAARMSSGSAPITASASNITHSAPTMAAGAAG